jgi:hypothetical protein
MYFIFLQSIRLTSEALAKVVIPENFWNPAYAGMTGPWFFSLLQEAQVTSLTN